MGRILPLFESLRNNLEAVFYCNDRAMDWPDTTCYMLHRSGGPKTGGIGATRPGRTPLGSRASQPSGARGTLGRRS